MKPRRSSLPTDARLLRPTKLRSPFRIARLRDALVLVLELGVLIGSAIFLEITGRPNKSERWDVLMFLLLISVFGVLSMLSQSVRLVALGAAFRFARRATRQVWAHLRLSCGIDFRPEQGAPLPTFPWPFALNAFLVACIALLYVYATSASVPHLPWALRDHIPYVLYLVIAGTLWSVLAVCDMGALILLYAVARRLLSVSTGLSRSARAALALFGPAIAIIPPLMLERWLGPKGLLVLLVMWLATPISVHFASAPNYAYTIRHHKSGRIYQFSMPALWASILQSLMFLVMLVVLLAQGYTISGRGEYSEQLAVTEVLGHAFFWLGSLFCGYLAIATFWIFYVRRPNEDPSLGSPPVLWVPAPSLGPSATAELALNRAGYVVSRAVTPQRRQDIDLVLFDARPTVTLPVGIPGYGVKASEWDSPALIDRVMRLERRSKRRRILAAFRELLVQAHAQNFRRGEGFFFAPQCWLIDGLQRDEMDHDEGFEWDIDSRQRVLPSYSSLFDIRLRRHLRATFKAADLDVLFVEDGVDIEGCLRVLEHLLLRYEQGKTDPVQEHEFLGLVGTRAHLQEVGFERSHHPLPGLREPKYDDISRARILLIVRDRGASQGDDDPPPPPEIAEDSDRWLRESLRNLFPSSLTR